MYRLIRKHKKQEHSFPSIVLVVAVGLSSRAQACPVLVEAYLIKKVLRLHVPCAMNIAAVA